MVSEQAVDGPSPLDSMIQRLQQEQDQRRATNDSSASASSSTTAAGVSTRSSRGTYCIALIAVQYVILYCKYIL